jgi:hypothetical protein
MIASVNSFRLTLCDLSASAFPLSFKVILRHQHPPHKRILAVNTCGKENQELRRAKDYLLRVLDPDRLASLAYLSKVRAREVWRRRGEFPWGNLIHQKQNAKPLGQLSELMSNTVRIPAYLGQECPAERLAGAQELINWPIKKAQAGKRGRRDSNPQPPA